jgi:hypothetical protein
VEILVFSNFDVQFDVGKKVLDRVSVVDQVILVFLVFVLCIWLVLNCVGQHF